VTKISQLSSIGDSLAIGDQFLIRDIDDAGSPNKSVTVSGITRALADGNATAPALAFAADKNTGIYRVGTDSLAVATNGVGRLFVDASGNVNIDSGTFYVDATNNVVGIGSSNPFAYGSNALLINNNTLTINQDGASEPILQFRSGTATQLGRIQYPPTGLRFVNVSGAAETLRITAAGLVGIGNSVPGYLLHLGGAAIAAPNGQIALGLIAGTTPSARIDGYRVDGSFAGELHLYTTSGGGTQTRAVTIDELQRVGIGTTSPGYTLVLSATSANIEINDFTSPDATSETGIRFSNNATNHALLGRFGSQDFRISNTGNIVFATGGISTANEKARLTSSGQLLVGTSTASSVQGRVFVVGNSSSATAEGEIHLARGATPTSQQNLGNIHFGGVGLEKAAQIICKKDGGTWTSGASHPSRLEFSTTADGASSPTERMRITQAGDLWLGSGIANPGYGSPSNGFGWRNDTDTLYVSAASDPALRLNRNGDGAVVEFRHTGSAVAVGSITVTVAATAYNTSSDYRLKENVTPVSDGITRLQQLKPSRFNFIAAPGHTVDGFIAHEAQAVVPECVTGTKDAVDADGNPVYQGIDQSKLVPLLTAALQEAVAKIESLEQRLNNAGIN
jgi:hypothetical protein